MLVEGTIIDRHWLGINDYCYEVESDSETLEVRGKGNRNVGDYVCEHAENEGETLKFAA